MTKETFSEAGYKHISYNISTKEHVLLNPDSELEVWFVNKNHASYGLIYKNTHLEFCYRLNFR